MHINSSRQVISRFAKAEKLQWQASRLTKKMSKEESKAEVARLVAAIDNLEEAVWTLRKQR